MKNNIRLKIVCKLNPDSLEVKLDQEKLEFRL